MQNESKWDRITRAVLGLIFLIFGLTLSAPVLKIAFYILAAVMLVTAATGFCLIYKIFGINTKSENK